MKLPYICRKLVLPSSVASDYYEPETVALTGTFEKGKSKGWIFVLVVVFIIVGVALVLVLKYKKRPKQINISKLPT